MTFPQFHPVPTRYTHILRVSHGKIVDIGELGIDKQISIACNIDTLPNNGVKSHLWIHRFSILLPCPIHTTRSRKPWISGTDSKHQINWTPNSSTENLGIGYVHLGTMLQDLQFFSIFQNIFMIIPLLRKGKVMRSKHICDFALLRGCIPVYKILYGKPTLSILTATSHQSPIVNIRFTCKLHDWQASIIANEGLLVTHVSVILSACTKHPDCLEGMVISASSSWNYNNHSLQTYAIVASTVTCAVLLALTR